jgi:hypothetical protein
MPNWAFLSRFFLHAAVLAWYFALAGRAERYPAARILHDDGRGRLGYDKMSGDDGTPGGPEGRSDDMY